MAPAESPPSHAQAAPINSNRTEREGFGDRPAGGNVKPASGDGSRAKADDAKRAPTFTLLDLSGNPVASSYGTRAVTVVHFWASWCVPCIREIPDLNRLAASIEPRGAALYAVALASGSAAELRSLVRTYDIRHRVLVGTDSVAKEFGGVMKFPTTFLVDRAGRIASRHSGATPEVQREVESAIAAMLAADAGGS